MAFPLKKDLRGVHGIKSILEDHDDETLHALMTNLAGHDMEAVLEAFIVFVIHPSVL